MKTMISILVFGFNAYDGVSSGPIPMVDKTACVSAAVLVSQIHGRTAFCVNQETGELVVTKDGKFLTN